MSTHYHVLAVGRDASPEEIRGAYINAAKQAHPDHGGSPDSMALVNEAYRTLKDPKLRRLHDDYIKTQFPRCPACDGTGERWKMRRFKPYRDGHCSACKGTGVATFEGDDE
jgi:DnaJ-class molecular chaperone